MDIRKLPFTNLIRKPVRSAALILMAAFLAFSAFGGAIVVSALREGLKSLENRLGADIILVPSSAQSKMSFKNMLLQGTTGAYYMDADNLTRTMEVDGVEKAAAQVFLASLKADCCSVKIQVIGFDPETDFIVQPWIEESYSRDLGDLDVVVGTQVSADVGETIRIYDERCKVVGRLATTGTGLDTAVYCNMETMDRLLRAAEDKGISHKISSDDGEEPISAIYIKVKEGYDIGKVNSTIQGHTRNASAVRTKSMITDVSGSLSGISRVVLILIGAVWVLSFFILLAAFTLIANERRGEFALLRLLGTSRRMLGYLAWKEALLVSAIGALCGLALAALAVFPFATLIETSLELPYLTPSLPGSLLIAAGVFLAVVAAGSVSSAISTVRLSRVDPGTVLRER